MNEARVVEVPGFALFGGQHGESSALRKVLAYHGQQYSEELLFGLGGGLGFIYWQGRNMRLPFISGRNRCFPNFVQSIGDAIGHPVRIQRDESARLAFARLRAELGAGRPVVCYGDTYKLPYFGARRHFGGHAFVIYRLDFARGTVSISDRGAHPRRVSLEALAAACSSRHRPFPPRNTMLKIEVRADAELRDDAIRRSIGDCCGAILNPPMRNLGLRGIRAFGRKFERARDKLSEGEFLAYVVEAYVDLELGGTGGSAFRPMYRRFLAEAHERLGDAYLQEAAELLDEALVAWRELLDALLPDDTPALAEVRARLHHHRELFENATMKQLEAAQAQERLADDGQAASELREHAGPGELRRRCGEVVKREKRVFEALERGLGRSS